MVKFMLNEQLHIARQPVPFKVLWVPYDKGALDRLAAEGTGTVYSGVAASGRFDGARSDFRQAKYNELSLVKWELSLELIKLGYDVLLLDPDLVILRNPLPYLETVGDCDLSFQMDSHFDPHGDSVRHAGGYALFDTDVTIPNFYNTGGFMLRSRPRTRVFLEAVIANGKAEHAKGSPLDDQGLFNR